MMTGKNSKPHEIKSWRPEDHTAVHALLVAAFPTGAEARLTQELAQEGDVVLGLVALDQNRISGFALWSAMQAPAGAFGLGPVAVLPGYRRQGIAAALIQTGHARLAEQGGGLVFVLGDPAYYSRFGFSAALAAAYASPYQGPHFMAHALGPALPRAAAGGAAIYAPAFARLG